MSICIYIPGGLNLRVGFDRVIIITEFDWLSALQLVNDLSRKIRAVILYKTLSMYDLQHGVTAVDLVEGTSLCIATSQDKRHEICDLLLPDKLLQTCQNVKIKKDRDFRVHAGGFSNHLVTELKHIPGTRYCAVAKNDGTSCIWEMGNETTDLMKEYKPIKKEFRPDFPIKMAVSGGNNKNKMVIGSCPDNILVIDTESWETNDYNMVTDMDNSKQISSMQLMAEEELLCCTVNGDLFKVDTRIKSGITEHKLLNKNSAAYWSISNFSDKSKTFLQMSNEGEVKQWDVRSIKEPISSFATDLSCTNNFDLLYIQQSPEENRFLVSGFDGCVYLFNNQSTESSGKTLEPVFVHEGHLINSDNQSETVIVTKHLRHPWQQDLIISCGNDGSIHAWQWNDDCKIT